MFHPKTAKMSPSAASILIISAVLLLSTATVTAHNITLILDQYPDFTTFNSLLSSTELAPVINRRKTLTILALTNDRIGDLAGKSADVQKRILSTHVILDYFDILKLNKLKDTKTVVTTLYQSTGTADDMQGFLNVVHSSTDGNIYFGSAMKGAPIDAKVEGSVAKQPYNISVLSISHVIIAPGIDGSFKPATPPPAKAPAPAGSKASPPPAADAPAPEEAAEEPAAADAPADSPADAPAADAPAADAPSPGPSPDDAPADADQSPPPANAAGKQMVSGVSIVLAVASIVLAAH